MTPHRFGDGLPTSCATNRTRSFGCVNRGRAINAAYRLKSCWDSTQYKYEEHVTWFEGHPAEWRLTTTCNTEKELGGEATRKMALLDGTAACLMLLLPQQPISCVGHTI